MTHLRFSVRGMLRRALAKRRDGFTVHAVRATLLVAVGTAALVIDEF